MSPDRKLYDYLRTTDPRGYRQIKMVLRFTGPVVIAVSALLIIGEVFEFDGKNRFDANSYPLFRFVRYELGWVVILLFASRWWRWSLRRE